MNPVKKIGIGTDVV